MSILETNICSVLKCVNPILFWQKKKILFMQLIIQKQPISQTEKKDVTLMCVIACNNHFVVSANNKLTCRDPEVNDFL